MFARHLPTPLRQSEARMIRLAESKSKCVVRMFLDDPEAGNAANLLAVERDAGWYELRLSDGDRTVTFDFQRGIDGVLRIDRMQDALTKLRGALTG